DVDMERFIKLSITRREESTSLAVPLANTLSNRNRSNNDARKPSKYKSSSSQLTALTPIQKEVMSRLFQHLTGNPPSVPKLEPGAQVSVDKRGIRTFSGYVGKLPCEMLRKQRPKDLQNQWHYHSSNRFRYTVNISSSRLFCMDPSCSQTVYSAQHDTLPEDLKKLILNMYKEYV